jgi:hypothetical protein
VSRRTHQLLRLAPSTQSDYRRLLTYAEGPFGTMPIAALDDPRVRREFMDWRDAVVRDSGTRAADYRLAANLGDAELGRPARHHHSQ